MAMVNMKLDKKAKEEMKGSPVTSPREMEYPYGLCLHLDDNSMKKLGIDIDDFSKGDKIMIKAVGEITGGGFHGEIGEEQKDTLDIQLTHIGFHDEEMPSDDDAEPEDKDGAMEGSAKEDELGWDDERKDGDRKLKVKGYF